MPLHPSESPPRTRGRIERPLGRRRTTAFWLGMILAGLALPSGCRAENGATPELVVAAAISLKPPLEKIAELYREQPETHPAAHLDFGASGLLSTQIERGAPIDVFASASEALLDRLEGRGLLLADTRHVLATNQLVVVAPQKSPRAFTSVSTLGSLDRLAIGNPATVPAGQYARQCLEHFDLWNALGDRLVLGEHARQVLDYAARGEVDASIVYATDARLLPGAVRVVLELPAACHDPIRYGIAAVAHTAHPDEARAFIARALGPEARGIFASFGFRAPDPPIP